MDFLGGLFFGIFELLGRGLVYLGYGKKGYLKLKKMDGRSLKLPSLLLGLLVFAWAFFGIFFYIAFRNSPDSIFALGIIIGCPIVYAIWFVKARKSVSRFVKPEETDEDIKEPGNKSNTPKNNDFEPQEEQEFSWDRLTNQK